MNYFSVFFYKITSFISSPEFLSALVNNRFYVILLVILLLRCKYATYSSMWLSAFMNIPGTFLHESAHFAVGWLLNACPTSFTLIPHKSEDGGYVMGSVGFRNTRFYNALPSALAPLMLLPIGFYFNRWYFAHVQVTILNYIAYIFIQTVLIENAIPSSTDFKVGFSYPLGLLLYGVIGVLAVVYFV